MLAAVLFPVVTLLGLLLTYPKLSLVALGGNLHVRRGARVAAKLRR